MPKEHDHDMLSLSKSFVPSKATGDFAKFLVEDIEEPALREAEVLRKILQKRRMAKLKKTFSAFELVAATHEEPE